VERALTQRYLKGSVILTTNLGIDTTYAVMPRSANYVGTAGTDD
jgi:hypothetical protein